MEGNFLAIISLVISITTVVLVFWQNYLIRKALQFQAYLNIENLPESEPGIPSGYKALNSLSKYIDYQTYVETELPETQQAIQNYVSFLNFIAHVVSDGNMSKFQAWGRYFVGFKVCYEKLYPWYIEGIRNTHYRGEKIAYATFEAMYLLVAEADKSESFKRKFMKYQLRRLGRNVAFKEAPQAKMEQTETSNSPLVEA